MIFQPKWRIFWENYVSLKQLKPQSLQPSHQGIQFQCISYYITFLIKSWWEVPASNHLLNSDNWLSWNLKVLSSSTRFWENGKIQEKLAKRRTEVDFLIVLSSFIWDILKILDHVTTQCGGGTQFRNEA